MTSAPAAIGRLSTHVLDTTLGRPAAGIPAVLEHIAPDGTSTEVGHGTTVTNCPKKDFCARRTSPWPPHV